ncbi:helix-turn-helix domain-containing protein [Clostridium gasigenes]|uniref:GH39 family glycosyl hydrolase n=1 Tax=Clostridium gasigenes TaxID=94869 RepID=UPI001C0CD23B|nr:helix-turn-helix domain-containing protein [Clostridium gasigenes]MBU3136363.1 helix-turn-helix domain-containing protein [Clostridium gasigenes]
MEYRYENIEHKLNIPIRIFTHYLEQFPYHWHEEMEMLFVLKGTVELFIDKEVNILEEGDIFLINRNEIHYVKSTNPLESSQLLVLQFNTEYLNKYYANLSKLQFKLDSRQNNKENEKFYNKIRSILATMMNVVINKEEPYELLISRHLLDIIIILINKFTINEKSEYKELNVSENRLINIIKYINNNYKDSEFAIAKIASEFYLNPQYVSRYFKENMGITIKTFLDNLRLNKSLNDLKLSKDRVIDIAHRHGFPDEKSYYRVFKSILGVTPTKYREVNGIEETNANVLNYFNINSRETLAKLFEYLRTNDSFFEVRKIGSNIKIIKTEEVIGELNHSFNKLITFGHAPYGLRNDFKKQLKKIQKDIGFEYVRFHGIFSDEMMLYNENSKGEVYYNFNHIDTLIDGLIEEGLKPFIEIGFMPKELSSSENKVFFWNCHASGPNNMEKWIDMVEKFTKHIINRYGINKVREWYFEFWNEPNLEKVFWDGSREEFFYFFRLTYESIKAIDKDIKVGGFGNLKFGEFNSWMNEFKTYSEKHKCFLDFFSFHAYQLECKYIDDIEIDITNEGIKYVESEDSEVKGNIKLKDILNIGDKGYISETIREMVEIGDGLPGKCKEYWITEWNSTMDCRDLVHDTCFMAAFIVKTCVENSNLVKGMGFWTFTDLFEEFRLKQNLFHGGFGFITYNGIKKASYHALEFLNKLGKEIVYKDKGLIVTKKGEDYQLLFYNYCHYNDLYRSLDYSQISHLNRYDVFKDSVERGYSLSLQINKGKYQLEKFRVNREEGSSFDAWVTMGAPEMLSEDGYKYLEKASEVGYKTWGEKVEKDLNINTELLPHEIQLIVVKKIY